MLRRSSEDLPPCGCGTPGSADPATCYCGVEDLLRIIRRRYSLAVMNAIHARGTARYHDVAAALPQASSSTLAETLHALDAAQLITRRDLSASGASLVVYAVTPSGTKLLSRLRNLLDEVHLP
ncbi:MAG: winged helix-turn-helix transcriptional regulator [Gemmatimonadales bacterium]